MNCPECKLANDQSALFCRNCGASLNGRAQTLPPTIISDFPSDKFETPPANGEIDLLGTTLDGRYRLDCKLGSGGMGVVYRARRLRIDDDVAIKVLHADQVVGSDVSERFRREAQAAARLKHPNAVSVYDFGISDGGICYLVMDLVAGESIRTLISRHGPFTPSIAADVIEQVCAALSEAHLHHIIHRDIKPDNIMVQVGAEGLRVKVLDFGIAKLRDVYASTLTQTGSVMGTPHYMSPEQCMGEELDSRSDIYSLGIVLYEMLAGVVPFNSPTSTAVVVQHVNEPPPSLRAINVNIPPAVERVVLHALEKQREARPQTASEFARELKAATQMAATGSLQEEIRAAPILPISDSIHPPFPPPTLVIGDTPLSGSQTFTTAGSAMSRTRKEHNVSRKNAILMIILSVVVLGSIAAIAYLLVGRQSTAIERLPDHYGVFVSDRDTLTELRRQEFRSVIQARDQLVGDSSLPRVGPKPVMVLYAEGQDIPVSDLKLVQLDGVDPSGKLTHWNYQVAPISGHPGMKQIKVASGLMSGKYAFALLTGYLDEGTHKLWPFQVNDNAPSPTDTPQIAMLPIKPKPLATVRPVVPTIPVAPPTGSTIAYCTDNNVVLRSSPSLNASKVSGLSRGQRLFILQMSSNYDTWRGITANWAYVQPENSSVRGWVFTHFVRQ